MVDVPNSGTTLPAPDHEDGWRTMRRITKRPKRWGRLHDGEVVWKQTAGRR